MRCAPATTPQDETRRLAALNASCYCLPMARAEIDAAIVKDTEAPGMTALLSDRPHLFAGTPVFLTEGELDAMKAQIRAIEAATALPDYQSAAFFRAGHDLLSLQPHLRGAFMGYDFHITPDGPRLIEINTNAGGAFLVHALDRAAQNGILTEHTPFSSGGFEDRVREMILSEWRRAGRTGKPTTLAIVDETPEDQYLYPDMFLAQEIFQSMGIRTIIVDASALEHRGNSLEYRGQPLDMVYNRLTDFSLSTPVSQSIRSALLRDDVVVTPAPRHHALFADKRNLIHLSSPDQLRSWGLGEEHLSPLSELLETVEVTRENADQLWANRKRLFFKPFAGFGSRATYRGEKLTRRVWADILQADYVAQAFVPAPVRGVATDAGDRPLKFDLRVYTYDGEPMLLAARVFQGQTTNFRTSGGGFAPVMLGGC